MIPQSTIIGFYIAGAIPMFVLVLGLVLLRTHHTYSFASVVVGFATFFLCNQILIPGVKGFMDQPSNMLIYYLILSIVTVILVGPIGYLGLKLVRRDRCTIYDAMAAGISYWIYTAVTNSMEYINEGKIADLYNKNELATLVTEEITMTDIIEYVNVLKTASLGQLLVQCAYFILMVATTVLVFLMVYHALKRQNFLYVLLGTAVYFVVLFGSYLAFLPNFTIYVIGVFTLLIAVIGSTLFYLRWYRQQQINLAIKRREFKEKRHAEYQAKIAAREAASAAETSQSSSAEPIPEPESSEDTEDPEGTDKSVDEE